MIRVRVRCESRTVFSETGVGKISHLWTDNSLFGGLIKRRDLEKDGQEESDEAYSDSDLGLTVTHSILRVIGGSALSGHTSGANNSSIIIKNASISFRPLHILRSSDLRCPTHSPRTPIVPSSPLVVRRFKIDTSRPAGPNTLSHGTPSLICVWLMADLGNPHALVVVTPCSH
jgi:hypothetical protein